MIDREKVLHGLECCVKDGACYHLDKCPYRNERECKRALTMDALALLKAQEPIAPVMKSFLISGEDEYYTSPKTAVCGACGEWLNTVAPRAKFCPQCGRAVKWE